MCPDEHEHLDDLRDEVRALKRQLADLQSRVDHLEGKEAPAPPPKPVQPEQPFMAAVKAKRAEPIPESPREAASAKATPPPLPKSPTPAPKPAPKPEPRKPSPLEIAVTRAKEKLGPAPDQSMEIYLTTRVLPVVAVLVLGTGVVFLAVLALQYFKDAWWMPYARLAGGYAIAAGLLAGGLRMRKRSASYGGLLFGSGMALTYFITFATHFIPFARIFERPEPTLALLAGVVIAWGGIAQYRNNQRMALVMTVIGHFTVILSTAYTDPPTPVGVLGIVALALGSAWFMIRNGWFIVGALGLVGAYANHAWFLMNSPPSDTFSAFIMAFSVITVYYLIFAASELLRRLRATDDPLRLSLRNGFVAANTLAFLWLGTGTFQAFAFSRPHLHVLYFGAAAALTLFGLAHHRFARRDPLFNTYLTKAVVVGTIGLALYFEGATLALSIALEAAALLVTARFSSLPVTRLLSFAAAALATVVTLGVLTEPGFFDIDDLQALAVVVPVAMTALVLYAAAVIYQRTDWSRGQLAAEVLPASIREVALALGLLKESSPHAHVRISTAYALGGSLVALLGCWQCLPALDAQPVLAGLTLATVLLAIALKVPGLTTVSLITAAAVPVLLIKYAAPEGAPYYGQEGFWSALTLTATGLAGVLALAEAHYRTRDRQGLWLNVTRSGSLTAQRLVYGAAAGITGSLVVLFFVREGHWSFWGAAMVLAAAVWSVAAGSTALRIPAFFWLLTAGCLGLIDHAEASIPWGEHLATIAMLFCAAVTTEPRFLGSRAWLGRTRMRGGAFLAYAAPFWLYGVYTFERLDHGTAIVYLGAGIVASALALPFLHRQAVAWGGVFLYFLATMHWPDRAPADYGFILLAAPPLLVAAALGGDTLFRRLKVFTWPLANCLLLALGLFLAMRYPRILAGPDAFYPWWGLVAVIFCGYAAWSKSIPGGVLAGLFTLFSTAILVVSGIEKDLTTLVIVSAYAVHIGLYFAAERLYQRAGNPLPRWMNPDVAPQFHRIFVFVPVVLVVLMLAAIPTLSSYYLTISWSLAAIATFGVAYVTREAWYRYAALSVLALALLRVTFVDVRQLDGVYRIMAWIFLGIVLLGVAHAYTVARGRGKRVDQTGDREESTHEE
jgi:uncharacterized membrane protein